MIDEDVVVVKPSFLRRLMRVPEASSVLESDSESEWSSGGGVAGRLRMLLDLLARFLKDIGAGAVSAMVGGGVWRCCQRWDCFELCFCTFT